MNLYRKYRPQSFTEMIGNETEIESLVNALQMKKSRPHSFLITGPSGCGKTTLARLAATSLGADDISTTELNSADNRGIETARSIIEQMHYIPPGSRVRVFIIDELHQTSKDWQNAMLKPLEDTPNRVYFFLCTTNPEKLISAFRNRCTHIRVEAQDDETLYRFLYKISRKEEMGISKEIIREIAEGCEGSPRLGLVLLEKISEMSDEKMMREAISMGEAASEDVIQLCRALLNDKAHWIAVSRILKTLKEKDPESVRLAVLGYMNSVLLGKDNKIAAVVIECFSEPFYNSGKAGLTLACYQAVNS